MDGNYIIDILQWSILILGALIILFMFFVIYLLKDDPKGQWYYESNSGTDGSVCECEKWRPCVYPLKGEKRLFVPDGVEANIPKDYICDKCEPFDVFL